MITMSGSVTTDMLLGVAGLIEDPDTRVARRARKAIQNAGEWGHHSFSRYCMVRGAYMSPVLWTLVDVIFRQGKKQFAEIRGDSLLFLQKLLLNLARPCDWEVPADVAEPVRLFFQRPAEVLEKVCLEENWDEWQGKDAEIAWKRNKYVDVKIGTFRTGN